MTSDTTGPLSDAAFVSGPERDNTHGQSVFASATDRSSAAAATPTAPDAAPRSDVHDGHAGTTTEHEGPSQVHQGRGAASIEADVQGEPPQGEARDALLTDALDEEWFGWWDRHAGLSVCYGCSAIIAGDARVARAARAQHWRFHVHVTGNVHR